MVAHRLLHHGVQADYILGVYHRDFVLGLLLDNYIFLSARFGRHLKYGQRPYTRCESANKESI
jgi:hypothetical protein